MIAAVVPVKSLASSKSRLVDDLGREVDDLGREVIEQLAIAMLGDVLEALSQTPELARVGVVTPDPDVARVAEAAGAEAVLRRYPGLNEALDGASKILAPGADDGCLVVLGDVAAVRPDEVSILLSSVDAPGVALAPSRDGGTSALYRTPRGVIPAGFGPNSAAVHRELAKQAGVAFHEVTLASLSLDVDTPADLRALLEEDTAGPRTRAALADLPESIRQVLGAANDEKQS